MKRAILVLAGAGFSFSALLITSIPAQQIPPPQKPLQHEVTVTLKLIQVYVTDKNGKPITNVDKSAFRVFDNGQIQTITEFEMHMANDAIIN